MAGKGTPLGLGFGPTASGKMYISLYYHRPTGVRPKKSAWCTSFSPHMEYGIFCDADAGHWQDPKGHYWGIHAKGATQLGSRGERLCRFPRTSNATDPWHGFPVSPLFEGDKDAPPDQFVQWWIDTGVVTKTVGRKIQRRKI